MFHAMLTLQGWWKVVNDPSSSEVDKAEARKALCGHYMNEMEEIRRKEDAEMDESPEGPPTHRKRKSQEDRDVSMARRSAKSPGSESGSGPEVVPKRRTR